MANFFLVSSSSQNRDRDLIKASLTQEDLVIDKDAFRVWRGHKDIILSTKEFDLLVFLAESSPAVSSREKLLEQIWGYENAFEIETRSVDQHISRLRQKIGASFIRTIPNRGYSFNFTHIKTSTCPLCGSSNEQHGKKTK